MDPSIIYWIPSRRHSLDAFILLTVHSQSDVYQRFPQHVFGGVCGPHKLDSSRLRLFSVKADYNRYLLAVTQHVGYLQPHLWTLLLTKSAERKPTMQLDITYIAYYTITIEVKENNESFKHSELLLQHRLGCGRAKMLSH